MNGRCDFRQGGRVCAHAEERHEIDDAGGAWCIGCWLRDDDALARHAFSDATVRV